MQSKFFIERKYCNRIWTLIILLLLIPNFKFGLLEIMYPTVDYVYNIGKLVSGVITILLCFYMKLQITVPLLLVSIIELWSFINAMLHQGINSVSVNSVLSVILVCLIINQFIKKYTGELLIAFSLLSEILVYANFVSMILNPDGMYGSIRTYWLLGNRNSFSIFIIPGLCYQSILKNYFGGAVRFYCFYFVSAISMIWCGSATGLIMMIIFSVLYFITEKKGIIVNSITISVVWLISLVLLVFLRIYNWFAPVISILDRELTLSGRTYIWDATILHILKNPVTGYGDVPYLVRSAKVIEGAGAVSAHNFVLEVMYRNGIIGMVLVMLFFAYTIYQLYKKRGTVCGNYFCIGLACIYIFSLTEFSLIAIHFIMLMGYISIMEKKLPEYCFSNKVRIKK